MQVCLGPDILSKWLASRGPDFRQSVSVFLLIHSTLNLKTNWKSFIGEGGHHIPQFPQWHLKFLLYVKHAPIVICQSPSHSLTLCKDPARQPHGTSIWTDLPSNNKLVLKLVPLQIIKRGERGLTCWTALFDSGGWTTVGWTHPTSSDPSRQSLEPVSTILSVYIVLYGITVTLESLWDALSLISAFEFSWLAEISRLSFSAVLFVAL